MKKGRRQRGKKGDFTPSTRERSSLKLSVYIQSSFLVFEYVQIKNPVKKHIIIMCRCFLVSRVLSVTLF